MRTAVIALAVAAAVCELAASWREDARWRARFKPFVVLTLLGSYIASADTVRGSFIAALALCFLGDMLLIPRKTFYAGGVAFFLAQLCFILSNSHYIKPGAFNALVVVVALFYAAVVAFISARLRSHARRSVVRLSMGYLVTVCVSSVSALLLALSTGGAAGWCVFAGSAFFAASDSTLLIRDYRKDIKIPKVYFIVMLTYIAALALMVLGYSRL